MEDVNSITFMGNNKYSFGPSLKKITFGCKVVTHCVMCANTAAEIKTMSNLYTSSNNVQSYNSGRPQ